MSPHIFAVAHRAYWRMLMQRQDQAIVPLGRSNTGKTAACQSILEYLVATVGSVDNRVTGRTCSGQPPPTQQPSNPTSPHGQREGVLRDTPAFSRMFWLCSGEDPGHVHGAQSLWHSTCWA